MTRARFVLGSDDLRQRFDAVRQAVISAPRNAPALAEEITAMRARVSGEHRPPPGHNGTHVARTQR